MNKTVEELVQQCLEDSQRWFPNSQTVTHHALALGGEVGEVQNIVKKVDRGSDSLDNDRTRLHLAQEIVDVLIYAFNLMGQPEFAGIRWDVIWDMKRSYNERRFGKTQEVPEALRGDDYSWGTNG